MSAQEMLLQAKMYEEDIRAEMQELQEELDQVLELIAELAAEAADNPYWTEEDENGGRLLKPMLDIRDQLLAGNRAERYFGKSYGPFLVKGFIATLTEDIPADHMEMYVDAQTRHFPQAMIGMGWQLAIPRGSDGEFMTEYRIPWWVNQGPYKSTMRLQDEWTAEDKLAQVKVQAERLMSRLDRQYFWAERQNATNAFKEKYPHYEPK